MNKTGVCEDYKDMFDAEFYLYFSEKMYLKEMMEKELQFIITRLAIKPEHSILDLPCGFGKYTCILAERGYNVVGVDINPIFIQKAIDTAKVKGLTSKFLHSDMRKINFRKEFDFVLTLDTSFGYFQHHENLLVLENVSRALVKGGYFFVELFNPYLSQLFDKGIKNCTAFDFDGNLLIDWRTYDQQQNRFKIKRVYIKNSVRKEAYIEIQNYSIEQMKLFLNNVNLEVVDIYGGQKGRLYDESSNRLVIIAKKK